MTASESGQDVCLRQFAMQIPSGDFGGGIFAQGWSGDVLYIM
jgi:hypothetical protein